MNSASKSFDCDGRKKNPIYLRDFKNRLAKHGFFFSRRTVKLFVENVENK